MKNTLDKRQAATRQFAVATAAINDVFDRHDELRRQLELVGGAPGGKDLVRAARDLLDAVPRLEETLTRLATAVNIASAYRSKSELAGDIDTRVSLLFPRVRSRDGGSGDSVVDDAADVDDRIADPAPPPSTGGGV